MGSKEDSKESYIVNRVKEAVNEYINGLDEVVTFVLLNTPDGLSVMTTLDTGTAINEFLSASGSAISEIARSYSEYSGIGALHSVIIWGERGHVIVKKLNDYLILAVGFLTKNIQRSMEIIGNMGVIILATLKESESSMDSKSLEIT